MYLPPVNKPKLSDRLPSSKIYMTQIPGRSQGEFVLHFGIGQVKLAFGNGGWESESRVYEIVDGEWSLLYTVPKGVTKKGFPWNREQESKHQPALKNPRK